MNTYIIYYTADGEPEAYEAYGSKDLKEQMKWLHAKKATSISIYKHGKNFSNDQDDVIECYQQLWK